MPERTVRKLNPAEQFFWVFGHVSPINVVVFAYLEGTVDVDRFRAALGEAQAAHPLAGVSISKDDSAALISRAAPGWIPVACSNERDTAPEQIVEAELTRPFALDEAPLIRARLHETSAGAFVLLTIHHSICDGRSAWKFLRDVFEAYVEPGESRPRHAVPVSMNDLLPADLQGPNLRALARTIRDVRKKEPGGSLRATALPGFDPRGPCRPILRSLAVDRSSFDRLRARCQSEEATVQGALGAAELLVLRELFPETDDPVLSLTSPVDLRRRWNSPSDGALGACVSQVTTTLAVPRSMVFWDLARAVTGDIKAQLTRGDAAIFYSLYDWALALPFDPKGLPRLSATFAAGPQAAILSNMGPLPSIEAEAKMGVLRIGFAFTPMPFQPLFMFATTYRDQLLLDFNFDVGKIPPALADGFVSGLRRRLTSAAD